MTCPEFLMSLTSPDLTVFDPSWHWEGVFSFCSDPHAGSKIEKNRLSLPCLQNRLSYFTVTHCRNEPARMLVYVLQLCCCRWLICHWKEIILSLCSCWYNCVALLRHSSIDAVGNKTHGSVWIAWEENSFSQADEVSFSSCMKLTASLNLSCLQP